MAKDWKLVPEMVGTRQLGLVAHTLGGQGFTQVWYLVSFVSLIHRYML
jgi:hypothetical protein